MIMYIYEAVRLCLRKRIKKIYNILYASYIRYLQIKIEHVDWSLFENNSCTHRKIQMFLMKITYLFSRANFFNFTGYALETEFVISCNDWVNPGEEETKGAGLLYRFWSKLRGRQDTQLLYYGTDPYTPDTTFPLGPEESDFLHDVVIRIANPIGEFVETWLSVKVSKPVVKSDVNELITLSSGQDSTLNGLLSSGKTQEAKQVIVAIASLINTSPTEVVFL